MSKNLVIGAIYKHYRNKNYYLVEKLALDCKTMESVVVYRSLYPECTNNIHPYQVWTRAKNSFLDNVITDEGEKPRFKFISMSY